jgi:hypothetical protein
MLALALAAALLAAPDATALVESRLPRTWAGRSAYARALVSAAHREGRRRGIDPLAILAVAEVESGYQPWVVRAQDGSHGPYQLMAHDSGPTEARRLLAGCGTGGLCEAPDIARRRRGSGPWTVAELRDPWIATWIAAYEIQRHVLGCLRARHVHRVAGCPAWLARLGHHNSGPRPPRPYYLSRLCAAWRRLRGSR